MGYIEDNFINEFEGNSLNYHGNTNEEYTKKTTYPIVLYPNSLLEINRLQPPLPDKPKEPNKPKEPFKPSGKQKINFLAKSCLFIGFLALFVIIVTSGIKISIIGTLILLILITIICIPFISKWKEKTKYNNDIKQYHKEEQEYRKKFQNYKKQCMKYEQDKEEILSSHNVNKYRREVMRKRLNQIVKPSLPLIAVKKSVSENYFYSLLTEYFGEKIRTDLIFTQNEKTYFPDFIYYDSTIDLIIDIEIDEPYVGYSGIPIHYIVNKKEDYSEQIIIYTVDDHRDRTINNGNWIIVKFAEQQIFEDASGCINFLNSVIKNAEQAFFDYSNQGILTTINRWTEEEAHEMEHNKFRFSYVPEKYHDLLKTNEESSIPISVRQERITVVEKRINEISQEQMHYFTLKYPDLLINIISNNHPLPYSMFKKHKDKLNWEGLSNNTYLPWSIGFIEEYADKWNWEILTNNKSLPWTTELLEIYKDKWDWARLSIGKDGKDPILKELWNCYDWRDKWRDKWCYEMDRLLGHSQRNRIFDVVIRLEASEKSSEMFFSKNPFDSDNRALIFCRLLDEVDMMHFFTKYRQWNTDFFDKFKNYEWAWKGLSANEQIDWSLDFIEKYMDKWDINELARNKCVYEIFKQHINNSLIDTVIASAESKK